MLTRAVKPNETSAMPYGSILPSACSEVHSKSDALDIDCTDPKTFARIQMRCSFNGCSNQ